jgi:alkanesulfonate monooxygenase SsuD/methylene tetrahydromethanopterin reductase-like flavin-dependent oxidoreductase (luciferase family)
MRLSCFSVADAYPGVPVDRLAQLLELAESCERFHLHAFWVGEHHFHSGGVCPSPSVVLAAAGARTRTVRLGSLVTVLPFHDPVDTAEQFALVDRLTQGRLNFGVGSGYVPLEFEGFGVRPEEKRTLLDQNLGTILAAFRGEEVRVRGGQRAVRINVVPVQRPNPPVWVAAQRRASVPSVGRAGHSIALLPYASVENMTGLRDLIREFRREVPPDASPIVSVAVHLSVGQGTEAPRRALQRYLDTRMAVLSDHLPEGPPTHRAPPPAQDIEDRGFALFGAARDVRSGIEELYRAGVDEVLGLFDFGGLPLAGAIRSMEQVSRMFVPVRPGPVPRLVEGSSHSITGPRSRAGSVF